MKVIVIGSGLAGLTSAALLAKEGFDVTLFEQNEMIGGVTATLEKDGYRWDWGQMIVPDLGEGEPARQILENLGVSEKVIGIKGYRENFFPDFRIERPKEYKGREWRKEYFKEIFPEDANGLETYYDIYERIHDLSALTTKKGMISKLKQLIKFLPIMGKKEWSAQQLMDYCFTNKKLQAVFIGILADYVASPKNFPGLIIPIINAESQYDERVPLDYDGHEHRSSWHFIKGGCIELVKALADVIVSNGGEIMTNTAITRIIIEKNAVNGVITSKNETREADLIIASGGAKELFLDLVGQKNLPQEYIQKYVKDLFTTESVFMIHLGVDYDPSIHQNGSALCYYYLTYDIEKAIEECQKGIYHEGKDGFLVYIPSVHSPEMAPPGHYAVTIYTIAPNEPVNGTWSANKNEWAEKLLDLAEEYVPGLREHEKIRIILTPEDFQKRTYLKHHAFGGTVPHLKIPPPRYKTPIDGLWFVGGQSENFGGVTGVMIGAYNVVNHILKEKGKETKVTVFRV